VNRFDRGRFYLENAESELFSMLFLQESRRRLVLARRPAAPTFPEILSTGL
jgi:hypothetical protein